MGTLRLVKAGRRIRGANDGLGAIAAAVGLVAPKIRIGHQRKSPRRAFFVAW